MPTWQKGALIEIDVRDRLMDDPVWVPAIFEEYARGNLIRVRIDAPDGHPWHRHNTGPLHETENHWGVRRRQP